MSWSCFSLDPVERKAERIAGSLTLVLTAVAYKYLVAQMVPRPWESIKLVSSPKGSGSFPGASRATKVPNISYNTLLDKYVLTCRSTSV